MNDCIWILIGQCNGFCCSMCDCKKYISINEKDGSEIADKWSELVENTLSGVRNDFANENGWGE